MAGHRFGDDEDQTSRHDQLVGMKQEASCWPPHIAVEMAGIDHPPFSRPSRVDHAMPVSNAIEAMSSGDLRLGQVGPTDQIHKKIDNENRHAHFSVARPPTICGRLCRSGPPARSRTAPALA